ncbi:MAG: hypothetical protein A2Z91_09650 [Deltaproteobacteria bacterium GWA2_38_16]|nr:MAG: hypothetical protein A2Z91_09650 [Deltaproteobacteria bacterium GWA2_38_16]OGQ02444.1 MAG: hypothetical protein A3D19_09080 [Deltaproteobacteria bacterium RIFCSPHIGHO2_02_FULL_38_15]OGQ59991.1 MAG: hypothetical protein A3G92_02375 [Deltaproteobacteria bacterium RIFCSPLOWO2_12_FULL_38_8]HBQ21103.1 hypothetical protein [Deltaproteobacteria bacterium]
MKYKDIDNFLFESLTVLKAKLSEYNDAVAKNDYFLAVTKNGKPETVLIKFDTLKELLKKYHSSARHYFDVAHLKRKKRNPIKEKWLKKWNQLGPYEKK